MKITASALSLNVKDERASAQFLQQYFGFAEAMAAEGFVSLSHPDLGYNVIFLRSGLSSLQPERLKSEDAQGLILAFVGEDIDTEYARLQAENAPIITPIQTEPWGERFFQLEDPNGVILQWVQWMSDVGGEPAFN